MNSPPYSRWALARQTLLVLHPPAGGAKVRVALAEVVASGEAVALVVGAASAEAVAIRGVDKATGTLIQAKSQLPRLPEGKAAVSTVSHQH